MLILSACQQREIQYNTTEKVNETNQDLLNSNVKVNCTAIIELLTHDGHAKIPVSASFGYSHLNRHARKHGVNRNNDSKQVLWL